MRKLVCDYTGEILAPVMGMLLGADVDLDRFKMAVGLAGFDFLSSVLWENRILLRGMYAIRERLPGWYEDEVFDVIAKQERRRDKMISYLRLLNERLDFDFCVIKTPDNYPDFGHDVDLLTCISGDEVRRHMKSIGFREIKQTLAERIADKINFVLGDFCNVEVHSGRIGETGEHISLVRYIMDGRIKVDFYGVGGLAVPNYVSRVFLICLQRLYRHFNLRACDVVNIIGWVKSGDLDVERCLKDARLFGIYPGVRWLLSFVNEVYDFYFGQKLIANVPVSNELSLRKRLIRFNRFRFLPQMYLRKMIWDVGHFEFGSLGRELLVLPLSVIAVAYLRFFGKEGVW